MIKKWSQSLISIVSNDKPEFFNKIFTEIFRATLAKSPVKFTYLIVQHTLEENNGEVIGC